MIGFYHHQKETAQHCAQKTWRRLLTLLCLSRACLGKMSVFIYKWLKKTVFSFDHSQRTCGIRQQLAEPLGRRCLRRLTVAMQPSDRRRRCAEGRPGFPVRADVLPLCHRLHHARGWRAGRASVPGSRGKVRLGLCDLCGKRPHPFCFQFVLLP